MSATPPMPEPRSLYRCLQCSRWVCYDGCRNHAKGCSFKRHAKRDCKIFEPEPFAYNDFVKFK